MTFASVSEYLQRCLGLVSPLEAEDRPVIDAVGAVPVEDVTAPVPLPRVSHAQCVGFALRSADTASAKLRHPVYLSVARNDEPLPWGGCIPVSSGSKLPEGADAVIDHGDADVEDGRIGLRVPVNVGDNIRFAGEDVASGAVIAPAGVPLRSSAVGALVAAGYARVKVHRRPRVAVIAAGQELTAVGAEVPDGSTPDANGPMVVVACRVHGFESRRVLVPSDDRDAVAAGLHEASQWADVLVTIGGNRQPGRAVMRDALSRDAAGGRAAGGAPTWWFGRVNMSPGSAHGCGVFGRSLTPVVSLPGDSVSAQVAFEVFVAPMLRKLHGYHNVASPMISAVAERGWSCSPNRTVFTRVSLTSRDGTVRAMPGGREGAHLIVGLAQSDAFAVTPVGSDTVDPGQQVLCLPMAGRAPRTEATAESPW